MRGWEGEKEGRGREGELESGRGIHKHTQTYAHIYNTHTHSHTPDELVHVQTLPVVVVGDGAILVLRPLLVLA